MKFKFTSRVWASLCAVLILGALSAAPVLAQEEGVPTVVDEVIAQVNTEVITLSMLNREMQEAAQSLMQARGLTEQQARAEVEKRRNEIIATLVNEQLLLQKGKEVGLTEEVEAEVNKRMLAVANEQNIKSIEVLEAEMRKAGLNPSAVKQSLRTEIMKNYVLGSEVDRKIYLGLTDAEVRAYYESHKDKFRKPESVSLSEIYLSTVGKDEGEVRARAEKIVAQLRSGADFGATAMVTSEREKDGKRVAPETKGKLGTFADNEISNEAVAAALKKVRAGGVTDPLKLGDGYIILRVDERTPAGEPTFNDNKVREAITMERMEKERKAYVDELRRDAYIELAASYRDSVGPLLKVEGERAPVGSTPAAPRPKKEEKKKNESNGNKKQ